MAELAFEYLLAALEATRGTPEANALRYLNMVGSITPKMERYRPAESRGTLAEYYRSKTVRKWSEWEAEGPLDVYTLPLILNSIVAGGIDGSGAVAATLTVDPDGANNSLTFTAVTAGPLGNEIWIQYVDPGVINSALNIDVDGSVIKVYLATDGTGDITTTADELKTALLLHPVASTMVTAADAGGDDGSGVLTAMAAAHLTGGTGADVTTPGGATNARLWTFVPTLTADDLEALTLWWGDPNVQAFRSGFCMPDELTISADASGTDGVTLSLSGQGLFPTKNAPGAGVPAMLAAPLIAPSAMELWIDDSSAIGTTPVTGRVVSAEVTIPSGVARKWLAAGPTGTLDFSSIGRQKRHVELKLTLEVPDLTQYDQWVAETSLKARIRFNGPLIEAGFYHFVEVDVYGPFDGHAWGEFEGTNRTVELTILSEYDATAGYDWCVRVQNDRSTL